MKDCELYKKSSCVMIVDGGGNVMIGMDRDGARVGVRACVRARACMCVIFVFCVCVIAGRERRWVEGTIVSKVS